MCASRNVRLVRGDQIRQRLHGDLLSRTEVNDRAPHLALVPQDDATDDVIDVDEIPGLQTVTLNSERFAFQELLQELPGHHCIIAFTWLARPVNHEETERQR